MMRHGLSPVAESWGCFQVAVRGLLTAVGSLVAKHGLYGMWASVGAVHELGCLVACGIFPDQGLSPSPLHWQVDS